MSDTELREVYSAGDEYEAHMIREMLESHGIEAQVVGEHLQNAIGRLPAVTISPRIWVHRELLEKSRQLIEKWFEDRAAEGQNPAKWKCQSCDESNESSFELCWQCQTARPEDV